MKVKANVHCGRFFFFPPFFLSKELAAIQLSLQLLGTSLGLKESAHHCGSKLGS